MPEMSEAELANLESKTETVRLLRLQKEEENATLDIELKEAKAKLAEIQENKGDFESKLNSIDHDAEQKRVAIKDAVKRHKREVEDFKNDMDSLKQASKDQMRQIIKERNEVERKVKESLDDLAVIEFQVASAAQDIDNMKRRIEIQKEQLRTSQKFVDKLEKEKREVESMYDRLRIDHDRLREDNQRAEMDNVQMQLKLSPEGRQQYLQEAAKREERRPMTPSKKRGGSSGGRRRRRTRDDDECSVYSGGEGEEEDDDAYSVVSSRRGSYSAARNRRDLSEDRGERFGGGGGGGGGGGARGRRATSRMSDLDDDYVPRRRSVDSALGGRESSLRPRGVGGFGQGVGIGAVGGRTEREMSVMSSRAARLARESGETGSRRLVGADGEPELGRGLTGLREFMMTSSTMTASRKKLPRPRDREREMSEF